MNFKKSLNIAFKHGTRTPKYGLRLNSENVLKNVSSLPCFELPTSSYLGKRNTASKDKISKAMLTMALLS
jgi:hypothetical protein